MLPPRRKLSLPAIFAGLLLLLCSLPGRADPLSFSFALTPGDTISGTPGSTIGWGYSIQNLDPVNWLSINSLDEGSFVNASTNPNIFDLPIIAPGGTATVDFVPDIAGLFQITWDGSAPAGFSNSGIFTVAGQFFDGDPLGAGNPIGDSVTQTAAYIATVSAPTATPVPEPSTLVLLCSGLAGIAFWRRTKEC